MPTEILMMVLAFLAGIALQYFQLTQRFLALFGIHKETDDGGTIRNFLYQASSTYLLLKIGFVGGIEVAAQGIQNVIAPSLLAMILASVWTFVVLLLLKARSSFNNVTQISIATHFGSVSVGTFIAALEFLEALNIAVTPSVALWLALMELPAVLIGMWQLGVRISTLIPLFKEKWSLAILPLAIILGGFFGSSIPEDLTTFIFKTIFTPILLYFLFEMGRKASQSFSRLKGKLGSVFFVGIAIPILGGLSGSAVTHLLGYDAGSAFIMGILMASASYVLAPLCMYEVVHSIYKPNKKVAEQVVATSMALSVGVTLPFNILIGFELYISAIEAMEKSSIYAYSSLALLGIVLLLSWVFRVKE